MAVNKGVWGIDIGQCALKAVRLELVEGKPTATAFDYVEHPKILSQPDADPDTLIREALDKFLSRNQIKNDEVAVGIAGQSGLARFVKLPPVEEKKIAEIVKFEAKQQIPFPLDEVVWDFQKIAGGESVDGFALETEIGLFAMKRDVISRYLGYFASSRIEVHTVQMSPLALVNFATYELLKKGGPAPAEGEGEGEAEAEDDAPKGKKRCAVVMDIGTDASNLIITDGGKIIWQRPIPLGGNNFTRALTKELKLTFAKAEHLKKNAAKSPEMANILKAIKPVLTDFVGEVQRSLGYFTNTHRDAHVAYMVGLGSAFKLPGLQKYLGDKLSLEVKKPTRFARLSGDTVLNDPLFQENVLTFPVAYGLALQGLGQARLATNLLPHEIRMERVIRAKKPYGVAAAALLLMGTAGMAAGFSSSWKPLQDESIDKAMKAAADAGSKATAQGARFTEKETTKEEKVKETEVGLAGGKERVNWLRLFEVGTEAIPRPGIKVADLIGEGARPGLAFQPADKVPDWVWKRLRTQKPADYSFEEWDRVLRSKPDPIPADLTVKPVVVPQAKWDEFLKQQPELWKLLVIRDRTGSLEPKLWQGDDEAGFAAFEWFERRMASGVKIEDTLADSLSNHPKSLAMVNIESVHTRWVLDPAAFLTAADEDIFKQFKGKMADNLKENEREWDETKGRYKPLWKLPEGESTTGVWVIEIRGYTDHAGAPKFIPQALLANLKNLDNFAREEGKIGRIVIGAADPVKGRVSHAFVYQVWTPKDAQTVGFAQIHESKLDRILGGNRGSGNNPTGEPSANPSGQPGLGAGAAEATPTAVLAAPWTALLPPSAGAAASTPNTSVGTAPSSAGGTQPTTGATGATGGAATTGAAPPADARLRYEFVVMMIWREPIPSGSGTQVDPAALPSGGQGPGGAAPIAPGGRG